LLAAEREGGEHLQGRDLADSALADRGQASLLSSFDGVFEQPRVICLSMLSAFERDCRWWATVAEQGRARAQIALLSSPPRNHQHRLLRSSPLINPIHQTRRLWPKKRIPSTSGQATTTVFGSPSCRGEKNPDPSSYALSSRSFSFRLTLSDTSELSFSP
jgi:hypothetical protein